MTQAAPAQQQGTDLRSMQGIAARLPLTIRPSVVEQLDAWEMLFPFEQKRLIRFLRGVDSFTEPELNRLTAQLRSVEGKMGVAHWQFSTTSNTMENSGQLARSAYYSEWRTAVAQLVAAVDARVQLIDGTEAMRHSLVVVVLPGNLPANAETAWGAWKTDGTEIAIRDDASSICELFLKGQPSIGGWPAQGSGAEPSDVWVIDADATPERRPAGTAFLKGSYLNCSILEPFRARFLSELNTIPRDTHVASQTLTTLQQKDWSRWWPAEFAGQDRLRNFVVELYLSGNGALIFSNAFVEWAAAEVFRRARPRVLMARFGLRNKPKPFTSIAIFENQSQVSTVPDVPDPENSALDAAMLARYVWLSALRYQEYEQALCLYVVEHLNAVRLIAPPGSGFETMRGPLSAGELHEAALRWLVS
jgi:hypothetical protein